MKRIKFSEIKKILAVNSIEAVSNLPDNESFLSLRSISKSTVNDLSFFSNIKYLDDLKNIEAKACLINKKYIDFLPKNCHPIIVSDPYYALALISNIFNSEVLNSNGIISKK